jgi:YjbE family integral membrane protein
MDMGTLGSITFNWDFMSGLLSVIIVNVTLSGDNAVVMAVAVRSLPRVQRRKAILIGTASAVLLNIVLTFFVARLLQLPCLKLVGGSLILWLAVNLLADVTPENDADREAGTFWHALRIIIIASLTTSLDNMLAVGAASRGNIYLLVFGLATSIPIIILASNLLTILIDEYPIVLYIGAAMLGKVGGEMIITDPVMANFLAPSECFIYLAEGLVAVSVILVGRLRLRMAQRVPIEDETSLSIPACPKAD